MKLKNKLLLGGLTAVLLAVMSFSAWKIWVIRSEYHTGEAAYEDISHTLLVITHDESIALQADRILSIEDGKITRDEVIRR